MKRRQSSKFERPLFLSLPPLLRSPFKMKWTTVFAFACALTPMAAAPSPPGAFQPQLYFPPPSPPRHLPHPSLDTPFAHAASTLSSSDYAAHDGARLGDARRDREENVGVGHFSEWARETKESFLDALREDRAQEWTIVMGNEGGDLDSMVSPSPSPPRARSQLVVNPWLIHSTRVGQCIDVRVLPHASASTCEGHCAVTDGSRRIGSQTGEQALSGVREDVNGTQGPPHAR